MSMSGRHEDLGPQDTGLEGVEVTAPAARPRLERMLPAQYYTANEVFERERESVFGRSWQFAAHRSEVPTTGRYLLLEAFGDGVLLVAGENDSPGTPSLHAFWNVCRHRGAVLCEARDSAPSAVCELPGRIQCPYHSWTWKLDGRLASAPNMADTPGFEPSDWPLLELRLEEWNGLVFINPDPEAPPLLDALTALCDTPLERYRIADLLSVHCQLYDVATNWKLLFQNYSECYHCPTVHPQLNKLSPWRDSWNEVTEGPVLGGPMRLARAETSLSTHGGRSAPPLPGLLPEDLDLVRYYTLFPNLFLSAHPDFVLLHRLEPLACDRTRIHCHWLFEPGREGSDPQPAIEFWDQTNRQDWALCERVQRGVSSRGYVPGPYASVESMLPAFDREYRRVMGLPADGASDSST